MQLAVMVQGSHVMMCLTSLEPIGEGTRLVLHCAVLWKVEMLF